MGFIKEPIGVDFVVESKPLTEGERKQISEIIDYYKKTGRKSKIRLSGIQTSRSSIRKEKKSVAQKQDSGI